MKKIIPSKNKHFKNIHTGNIYEGVVYLGIYDSADNYVEVTEEEYQEWLHKDEENQATGEDLYNALSELGVSDD